MSNPNSLIENPTEVTERDKALYLLGFKSVAQAKIDDLKDWVSNLASHGDKEEDCQRLVILNAISQVEMAINGTEYEDLI